MNRVIIMRMNALSMQVCCVKDATDEEIIRECNDNNPCGTTHGWGPVVRTLDDNDPEIAKRSLPVQCADYENRIHLIIQC